MNRILNCLCMIICTFPILAQPGQINLGDAKGAAFGKVLDAHSEVPVEYATVALLSADSSLINGTTTDSLGVFRLNIDAYGSYFLRIDFIGYQSSFTPLFSISSDSKLARIGVVELSASNIQLEEFEVQGEKTEAQFTLDKKTFNIQKDLSSVGGTATDVLEKLPSVMVDMDGNVSLRGSGNVRILIDGKPSSLTGISSQDALSQIPADAIESVEIITNPSAKYDSEGMAGIINIILKKEKEKGFNGIVSATGSTAMEGDAAFNFNWNSGKINLFGNYSGGYDRSLGGGTVERELIFNDTSTFSSQQNDFFRTGWGHTFKGGADFVINPSSSITASVLYRRSDRKSTNEIKYIFYDHLRNPVSLSERSSYEEELDNSWDYTFSYKKDFRKKGQQLTVDVSYSMGSETEDTDIEQVNLLPDGTPFPGPGIMQHTLNQEAQDNLIFQADYVHPLSFGKLEAGLKSSLRHIDIDYDLEQFDDKNNEWAYLTGLSNHFLYDEDIHALYFLFSSQVDKLKYQAGLRSEYSLVSTELRETNEQNERDYLDYFPTAHISYSLKENMMLQASYSRRINRPSFWNLNPFFSYSDPLNLRTGNPNLEPEYIHSGELGFLLYGQKGTFSTSIYYKRTDDVISRVQNINEAGVAITTFENLFSSDAYGGEFYISHKITPWWNINLSGNYYYTVINGENIEEGFGVEYFGWFGRLMSGWSFGRGWNAQLMGLYRGPMQMPQGGMKAMYWADASVKKEILNGKGAVSLRLSDIFNTRQFAYETADDNYHINGVFSRKSRHLYLSFSYKFNNYKQRDRQRPDMNDGDMDEIGF